MLNRVTASTSAPVARLWRSLFRRASRAPVYITYRGTHSHVLLSLADYRRLAPTAPNAVSSARQPAERPTDRAASGFDVLCRIDAYADYVARVEAGSPEDAARWAADDPESYCWEYQQTAEFDARMYVTLDRDGDEIDGTEVDDS